MMEWRKEKNLVFCIAIILLLKIEPSRSIEYYDLSYSYFDEIAQAYCASKFQGWVFAIRRHCSTAPTCNEMCDNAAPEILDSISHQRKKVSCFDAFGIKKITHD
ncbi:uncharacterized protein LOC132754873 [Ruditapes philippinarum]|uniref:uncharacterized protein LOC132754873 n=1 Tax=Ruditapes philippinarum TaxID=129788 RepID=UPI00295BC254|nr:uncharacterized protein LOC132754873 [Ruditapes philippinarum]